MSARPSTLAVVPARGGSRGIERKNVKLLGGRPLLAWVLESIAASGVVDRTIVSTDDLEIAEVAREHGADVPFLRPPELATNDAPAIPVIAHALAQVPDGECVLYAQPTEPFVRPGQIRDALALLLEREADSAITMVEVPRNFHPYHVRIEQDGLLEFEHSELHYAHPTRQSDPSRYAFANVCWFRRQAFLAERRLEAGRRVGLIVDSVSALDVNTPDDWALAEALIVAGLTG